MAATVDLCERVLCLRFQCYERTQVCCRLSPLCWRGQYGSDSEMDKNIHHSAHPSKERVDHKGRTLPATLSMYIETEGTPDLATLSPFVKVYRKLRSGPLAMLAKLHPSIQGSVCNNGKS